MTKPKNPFAGRKPLHTKAEIDALPNLILAMLSREPMCTTAEIAKRFGFEEGAIRKRLNAFAEEGKVYFTTRPTPCKRGQVIYWQFGPAPAGHVVQARTMGRRKTIPATFEAHQRTTRNYPVIGRRDPLVAAMFGPPGAQP